MRISPAGSKVSKVAGSVKVEPDFEQEDKQILQIARGLCQQLDIENVLPERISWQEQYSRRGRLSQDKYGNPIGLELTPHYPLLDKRTLVLKPVMRGRLESEEWRPLLASSIIFYGRLWSEVSSRSVACFAPTLVLITIFLLGILLHNPLFNQLLPVVAIAGLIVITAVLGVYASLLFSRRFMLLADTRAAQIVGADRIADVLRKIASLEQLDSERDRMSAWAWTDYGDAPSIKKRIENLHRS